MANTEPLADMYGPPNRVQGAGVGEIEEQHAESQIQPSAGQSPFASGPRLDTLEQQQHELLEQQQRFAEALRRAEEGQAK